MAQNIKLSGRQQIAALGIGIAIVTVVIGYNLLSPGSSTQDSHDMHQKDAHEEAVLFNQIQLSPRARALAQVEVVPALRRQVEAEVRLFGRLNYDETRLAHITAWVPNRIERMYLNFTGISVAKGDHMVEIYSPELLTAQVQTTLTINAPMSGVVIHKEVVEGRYVQVGTRIYSIADLAELWLE
jgi:acetyl/propionyl-CoA carboxylase alpha subunit